MNRTELSILIPTYNDCCAELVNSLVQQAMRLSGLSYEIIVLDDASNRPEVLLQAAYINELRNTRFVRRETNVGRAKIRNILTSMARYQWLLFLDSDMEIVSPDFLERYLQAPPEATVVYGGNCVQRDRLPHEGTLRYRCEKAAEQTHDAAQRNKQPYQHFTTSNFLVAKWVMEAHPFDERIQTYGYEDVLFGKTLRTAGIPILHIDNPVGFGTFESNRSFLAKTEEAMHTLFQYRKELVGYSNVLHTYAHLHRFRLAWLVRLLFLCVKKRMRTHLLSTHPSLFVFKCYKLGFYASLPHCQQQG